MENKFTVESTSLAGLLVITPRILSDNRGFFIETWNERDFADLSIADHFVQNYWTRSRRNVLRGLHCQLPPKPTSKIIQCTDGEIFDVVVDLRPKSPTFKKWASFMLNGQDNKMLYIPPGFVHGFCVLSETAETSYKVSEFFYKQYDGGVRWNDPEIAVEWPVKDPTLSEKDNNLPLLREMQEKLSW